MGGGGGGERRGVPAISEAEWVVMRVVWEGSPMTANEVVAALVGQASWKPKTVHTLLRRLVDKGALAFDKRGREFVYRPLVEERECQLAESRTFLSRVFGGQLSPLVAAFVESEKLSADEIAQLEKILKEGQKS